VKRERSGAGRHHMIGVLEPRRWSQNRAVVAANSDAREENKTQEAANLSMDLFMPRKLIAQACPRRAARAVDDSEPKLGVTDEKKGQTDCYEEEGIIAISQNPRLQVQTGAPDQRRRCGALR